MRHNLSLNKCFEKVENKMSGSSRKGCLWALNLARIDKMEEEMHKWKRKDLAAIHRSMANPGEAWPPALAHAPHTRRMRRPAPSPALPVSRPPATRPSHCGEGTGTWGTSLPSPPPPSGRSTEGPGGKHDKLWNRTKQPPVSHAEFLHHRGRTLLSYLSHHVGTAVNNYVIVTPNVGRHEEKW